MGSYVFRSLGGSDDLRLARWATPYVVGGSDDDTVHYDSIQTAINAAVAAGATVDSPAIILVKAESYTENITLYPGIHVAGITGESQTGPKVRGYVQFSAAAAGLPDENYASWDGVDIEPPQDDLALYFYGANPQGLKISNVRIYADLNNTAVSITNTGADSFFRMFNVKVINANGGASSSCMLVATTSTTNLYIRESDFYCVRAQVSVQISGPIFYDFRDIHCIGRVVIEASAPTDPYGVLAQALIESEADPEGVMVIDSDAPSDGNYTLLQDVALVNYAAPVPASAVTGAGAFGYSNVSSMNSVGTLGNGFAIALTATDMQL